MRIPDRTPIRAICYIVFAITLGFGLPAQSAQQQWSSAYVHWDFEGSPKDIFNIDQEMWIAFQADSTQWVMQWSWTADPAHGGYLGFNTGHNSDGGKGQAIFSIWNATESNSGPLATCLPFPPEGGPGLSCRQPFAIRSDRFYRLHLARTTTDETGAWWTASISEEQRSGPPVEYVLGSLRVDATLTTISGNSITSFIEYFGTAVERCSEVPPAAVFVSAPQANKDDTTHRYRYASSFSRFSTPDQKCTNGNESAGASFKGDPFSLRVESWSALYPDDPPSSDGAFLFLGSDFGKHSLGYNLRNPPSTLVPPPYTVVLFPPDPSK